MGYPPEKLFGRCFFKCLIRHPLILGTLQFKDLKWIWLFKVRMLMLLLMLLSFCLLPGLRGTGVQLKAFFLRAA